MNDILSAASATSPASAASIVSAVAGPSAAEPSAGSLGAAVSGALSSGVGVTAAKGFRASGTAAGIKSSGALDLALVVNDGPRFDAAAAFTSNRVKAAPVYWTEQVIKTGLLHAVVLNSGGANACTGPLGFQDTHATAERAAEILGTSAAAIGVCSTGLIGVRLPLDNLLKGLIGAAAGLSVQGGADAAEAIRTTDTVAKTAAVARDGYTVGGMIKGAGMLAPGLATMLCVLTTDAEVPAVVLDSALRSATALTLDRIDSDGCMSTNDTVILMASGASGVAPDPADFAEAVAAVCADLARQLLADAEGATKEIEIEVVNAADEADGLEVARAIARNNLFKCAMYGEDPNWGRVLAAVGTTRAAFEPDRLAVAINGVWACRDGAAGEDRELCDLSGRHITVTVDLKAGPASVTVWTNDLSKEYVHENSAYSS